MHIMLHCNTTGIQTYSTMFNPLMPTVAICVNYKASCARPSFAIFDIRAL